MGLSVLVFLNILKPVILSSVQLSQYKSDAYSFILQDDWKPVPLKADHGLFQCLANCDYCWIVKYNKTTKECIEYNAWNLHFSPGATTGIDYIYTNDIQGVQEIVQIKAQLDPSSDPIIYPDTFDVKLCFTVTDVSNGNDVTSCCTATGLTLADYQLTTFEGDTIGECQGFSIGAGSLYKLSAIPTLAVTYRGAGSRSFAIIRGHTAQAAFGIDQLISSTGSEHQRTAWNVGINRP